MSAITHKIVFSAKVANLTFLRTGEGENPETDLSIIRWEDGRAFIPADTFVRVLRNWFMYSTQIKKQDETWALVDTFLRAKQLDSLDEARRMQIVHFWGGHKEYSNSTLYPGIPESARHFVIDELLCEANAHTRVKDSIRMDQKTGRVKDKGKFDFELIEPGAQFSLQGEVIVREKWDPDFMENMLCYLLNTLNASDNLVQIGSNVTNGYGHISIVPNSMAYKRYQFPEDGVRYMEHLYDNNRIEWKQELKPNELFRTYAPRTEIVCDLQLRTSFLHGDAPGLDPKPLEDSQTFKLHDGRIVFAGEMFKGGLRSRMIQIANTLFGQEAMKIISELTGSVDPDERRSNDLHGGVMEILPCFLNQSDVDEEVQPGIRIDYFTGGAMTGALYGNKKAWHKQETVRLHIRIFETSGNNVLAQTGLVLQAIKDLCTGYLALAGKKGEGSGVFLGKALTVKNIDRDPIHAIQEARFQMDPENYGTIRQGTFSDPHGLFKSIEDNYKTYINETVEIE